MFKFIKSLFSEPEPESQYIPVPKWCHPGKFGKDIYCPVCKQTEHVYNFKWAKMTCGGCEITTTKYEWLLRRR